MQMQDGVSALRGGLRDAKDAAAKQNQLFFCSKPLHGELGRHNTISLFCR